MYVSSSPDSICLHADSCMGAATGKTGSSAGHSDHTNWLYKPGEKVKFKVAVLKCNIPQDNLEVRYEISEDMMKPHQTGKQPLKNEKLEINAGTMKKRRVPALPRFRHLPRA